MPTADELETFARERQLADRAYNEALTNLDQAIGAAANGDPRVPAEVSRLATTLIVFLQQITAFVETKDRELSAQMAERRRELLPAIESIGELRSQIAIMQRTVHMLTRQPATAPGRISSPPATSHQPPATDVKYVAFEDQFRGSGEAIAERLRAYVPLFAGASNVIDLGCGRGELLAALKSGGVAARGIDTNAEMVAIARERGLDVVEADALTALQEAPDGSLGGVVAAQVVEHLEPAYLLRLLDVAYDKLRPGAPIVIETINPACWLAFFSSYIRDLTHVRPVHPETLQYLLRASGFTRVTIRYSEPVPESVKMKSVHLPPEVLASTDPSALALTSVAHTLNANGAILNSLLFTHLDYAAIGYKS
ncbi:MAG TPA: methyltransferase domain-containing protein [Vicinamibacterales bacterium]